MSDGPLTPLNKNGWRGQQRTTISEGGLAVVVDSMASRSPASVLAFGYGVGFPGGDAPGVVSYTLLTPTKETYFGFSWKPSDPWQNHRESGVNKIALLFPATPGAGTMFLMMFFNGTNYAIHVETTFANDTRNLAPNAKATSVVLGAWHRIGWYVKYSTTAASRDGVVRWWLDDVLQGEYSDLQMPGDAGFNEYTIAPVWGGVGDRKSVPDCFWYDYARISLR